MLGDITPLLITYNEACNIERTLAALAWADRIVVVDSGSTDGTLEILSRHPRVEVFHHPFVDFAGQCNYGLTFVTSPWVLSLDADYELSPALVAELAGLTPAAATAGYRAAFVYRIHGRPLRGSLYPPRVVLFRRDAATYVQEGHAHRLRLGAGEVLPLRARIFHDDRKPLDRWLATQRLYARAEADYLLRGAALRPSGRLRRLAWPAPFAVFLYTLLVKGCALDGWPGWYYALQRAVAEALLAIEIIDRRLRSDLKG